MNPRTFDQVVGLAGLIQATYLVDQIARTGMADSAPYQASIDSLFAIDAESSLEVFGGRTGIDLGLRVLRDLLSGSGRDNYRQVMRYAMSILHLKKALDQQPKMLDTITDRLQHAEYATDNFSSSDSDIASKVAAIYQDTISTLAFRIQVSGSVEQLQKPANQDRVRALLLAAIRAAILWRQKGGSRLHLLLGRRRLLKAVNQLLQS